MTTDASHGQHQDTTGGSDGRDGAEGPRMPGVSTMDRRPDPPLRRAPGSQWRRIDSLDDLRAIAEDWFGNPTPLEWDEIRFVMDGIRRVKLPGRKPELKFSEFVAEMYEVLREARETCAVDKDGRNVELYFGDMMRRLEDAAEVVNDRITSRGGVLCGARP